MQFDPNEKFYQLTGYTIDGKRQLGDDGAFGQVFVGFKKG